MKHFILINILLFFSSLFSFFMASAQPTPKEIRLGLNWKPEPQFGGFYELNRLDLLKGSGSSLKIIEGGSGTPTVQMVASNQIEFGIISGDELLISRERGSDLVALFAVYQDNPQAIMTHAESNFKSLSDVFKKKGTLLIQSGLPYAQYLLKKNEKPAVQIAPYSGGISLFLNDKTISQQCFYTSEPIAAQKLGANTKVFLVADAGFNPYTTVVVARLEYINKHPDLTKQLVKHLRSSWASYLKDPNSTNVLMNRLNPSMDPQTFLESAQLQKELIQTKTTGSAGLGAMTENRWNDLHSQLLEMKILKKAQFNAKDVFINY